jgi:hypothetical protein
MNAPFPGFTPELLAQIAQGAFRPPQAMGGGMSSPGLQMPQQGGGDGGLGAGMAGLGMGLGMMRRMPPGWVPTSSGSEPGRTAGGGDLGGYGASPVDPMSGNPNAQPTEIFNPTGAASSPSSGLSNILSWLRLGSSGGS